MIEVATSELLKIWNFIKMESTEMLMFYHRHHAPDCPQEARELIAIELVWRRAIYHCKNNSIPPPPATSPEVRVQ